VPCWLEQQADRGNRGTTRVDAHDVRDSDLARGSPLMFAHFIPNGTYRSTGQDVEAAGLTTSNDRSLDYVAAASLDEQSPLIEITR
jgi:hypothetical protein